MSPDTLLINVIGIGTRTANQLKKLKLETIKDLLFYFPVRYEDLSKIVAIRDITLGIKITVHGKIISINTSKSHRKRIAITEAFISDNTGLLRVIWFNQGFIEKILKEQDNISLSGVATSDKNGLVMLSPVYEKNKSENNNQLAYKTPIQGLPNLDAVQSIQNSKFKIQNSHNGIAASTGAFDAEMRQIGKSCIHTGRLVPIYSLTSKLTNKQIQYLINLILPHSRLLKEWLPKQILEEYKLINLQDAISEIHFPSSAPRTEYVKKRFQFEELFLACLTSQKLKCDLGHNKSFIIKFKQFETKKFVDGLQFKLTSDQKKTAWEIINDLAKPIPMNRLVEGSVGSGKTIVAAIAMLNIILNDYQVAYLAPTEILAKQHFLTLNKLFNKTKINIALLTSNYIIINCNGITNNVSRSVLKDQLINKKIDLLIGTHALLSSDITFAKLALVIVDEQHRFGVEQRKQLKLKGSAVSFLPHFLSMTATPIPRSLALTIYGDLNLSIIKAMPLDRKKIISKLVDSVNRSKAYDFVRNEIRKGRQAFVICPIIETSSTLAIKSAKAEYDRLSKEIFSDLKLELLHGRTKTEIAENIMANFSNKKTDILVTTSMIEVGIDVPNVSTMIIENAERFGLAQLHQLRGRIGRSKYPSYCFIFSGDEVSDKTKERLNTFINIDDSFLLAEKDLELRGPGELYGSMQSGIPELKIANLADHVLIKQAQEAATKIIEDDYTLKKYPLLKERVDKAQRMIHKE